MYEYVFFDLDGTLTQSEFGIIESIKYSIEKMGFPVQEDAAYRPFIGPALYDSYQEYAGMTPEQAIEATAYYREFYTREAYKNSPVYAGIRECLTKLKEAGKKVYVATAKPQEMAEAVVDHHGLTPFFEKIYGSNIQEKSPTKAELLKNLCHAEGIDAKDAVMIGDRKYDMDAGRANGIDTIGVLFGYGDRAELEEHGATYLVEEAMDILPIVLS